MPAPYDPLNLFINLDTFARLSDSPAGSKLSFDRGTGRFSIQKPGALQSVARTLSHDTVTSEGSFGGPIRAVFATAYPQRHLIGARIDAALGGLRTLQQSYTGDKRAALDAVISDAEHGVRKDPEVLIRLREKYKRFVILGFSQSMFLPVDNLGVCYSFSLDWARRIILGGKASFVKSGKQDGLALESSTTPDAMQKTRMMKKVDSRIRNLQAGFTRFAQQTPPVAPRKALPRLVTELATEEKFRKKNFGNLQVFEAELVAQGIANDARGSGVLAAVERRTDEPDLRNGSRVFIVNFRHKNDPGGHAIGIHLPGDGLHFFDPNIGEFWFPDAGRAGRDAFLDDWWFLLYLERQSADEQLETLRRGQIFGSWKLQGVSETPE
jgi:hypothetical protein